MTGKTDRRILRTRRALQNALLKLMQKKKIGEITTTELCAAADINRNTFYVYYDNPSDLLEEIEEKLITEIRSILEGVPEEGITLSLFRAFQDKQEIYRVLFTNENSRLAGFVRELCKQRNIYHWKGDRIDPVQGELYFQFAAAGAGKLVRIWLEEGCKMPAEELCRFIDQISLYGMNSLIG